MKGLLMQMDFRAEQAVQELGSRVTRRWAVDVTPPLPCPQRLLRFC